MAADKRPRRQATTKRRAPAILDSEAAIIEVELVGLESPNRSAAEAVQPCGIAAAVSGECPDDVRLCRSYMMETFGGGSVEAVPGFDASLALTAGIAQPGIICWPQLQPAAPSRPLEMVAESVLGQDTRRPVPNSASVPWRCIAFLDISYVSGRRGSGTGWLIGPKTLVTAAHCVFSQEAGAAARIVATPGYSRGAAPFGQFSVVDLLFNPAWKTSFDPVLDFALVFLDRAPGIGWFGMAAASDANLSRVIVNIAGYPLDARGVQAFDASRILTLDRNFIYHAIDTEIGQSGAPLFWSDRDQRIGLGIHTYGVDPNRPSNMARRITPGLLDLFERSVR